MPDQELHKDQTELILRYLSGNATDAEVQQLETWVLAAPKNKRQFVNLKKAWMLSGMQEDDQEVDLDQNWKQISEQLFESSKVVDLPRRSYRNRWLRIAAAIALVTVASIGILLRLGGEKPMTVATVDIVRSFELPDGSLITLDQSSSLTYTPIEANKELGTAAQRQVTLQGEAFFEVARAEDRPFLIRSGELEVEVLGTSFYLDAREAAAAMQVIVESGTVAVRVETADTITLEAGEKAIYQKEERQLTTLSNDNPNYDLKNLNILIFEESRLEEVAFALSRRFNVDISIGGIENSGNCILTTTFDDAPLDDILLFLEATWGITAERSGGIIFLSGSACN